MPFFLLAVLSAATLADVSFIAGAWRGEINGMPVEEHWMKPEGDAMVGMYRILKGGKTVMTELCAIEQRPEGPVLLLRHFSPGLVAREEKDKPMVFALESHAPNRAVFYQGERKTRLIFERVPGGELQVTLEKETEGRTTRSEFRYRPVGAAAQ